MNRLISYCGIVALLAVLTAPTGCKKATEDVPETPTSETTTVNYSTAEPIELIELTTMKAYDEFIQNTDIAVVKFTATWCGPCQALTPELEKMAGYYQTEGVKIAEVDVDKMDKLANDMHITSIPYTVLFYHGNQLQAITGADAPSIASLIDSVCQKGSELEATNDESKEEEAAKDWVDEEIEQAEKEDAVPAHGGWQAPNGPYSNSEPVATKMLDGMDEFNEYVAANKYALVEFGAEWCVWCKRLHPEVEKMGGYYKERGLVVAEVDSDKSPDVAKQFKVGGIPHTVLLRDGEFFDEVIGCDPVALTKAIEAMLNGDSATTEDSEEPEESTL